LTGIDHDRGDPDDEIDNGAGTINLVVVGNSTANLATTLPPAYRA